MHGIGSTRHSPSHQGSRACWFCSSKRSSSEQQFLGWGKLPELWSDTPSPSTPSLSHLASYRWCRMSSRSPDISPTEGTGSRSGQGRWGKLLSWRHKRGSTEAPEPLQQQSKCCLLTYATLSVGSKSHRCTATKQLQAWATSISLLRSAFGARRPPWCPPPPWWSLRQSHHSSVPVQWLPPPLICSVSLRFRVWNEVWTSGKCRVSYSSSYGFISSKNRPRPGQQARACGPCFWVL